MRQGIIDLFEGGFDRLPTDEGLDYWVNSGLTLDEIAATFDSDAIEEEYTPFANGGVVTKPTRGLVAEAGYSEAIIPLKDPNDPLGQKELIKVMQQEMKQLREEMQTTNGELKDIKEYSRNTDNNTKSKRVVAA